MIHSRRLAGDACVMAPTEEPVPSEMEDVFSPEEQRMEKSPSAGEKPLSARPASVFHIRNTSYFMSFYQEDGQEYRLWGSSETAG